MIRGSDTALGFNAEYRIPVSGGMETAALFDLGIVGLLSQNRVLSSVPEGFTLLGESRSLMAGSTGLELRVPLPVISRSFRVSWAVNPLRSGLTFQSKDGTKVSFSAPHSALRFGLGTLF